jgi:putative NADH-flavin reductase
MRSPTEKRWACCARPPISIGPSTPPPPRSGRGAALGQFRVGATKLIFDADGHSRISYPDYAQAFVDDLEAPRFAKLVATVAY